MYETNNEIFMPYSDKNICSLLPCVVTLNTEFCMFLLIIFLNYAQNLTKNPKIDFTQIAKSLNL